MRMRPTYGAAVVFAATLAATVGSPGPAEAFFFLPIFQQSQPSFESRTPGDNNRWRRGDRARTRPPSRSAVHRDAREARRGEVELHLLGQEREAAREIRGQLVAGEIRGQLVAGFAHP